MPELPEVERAATMLRAAVVGHTILQVRALHPAIARTLTSTAIAKLIDHRIVSVERRAKHQLVCLDDGHVLEVHFKMTGDWAIGLEGDEDRPLERARITLDNGTRVSLIDGRAFAVMRVHAPGELVLPDLGPEPTDPAFTGERMHEALTHKKTLSIKQALLDQRLVAGLGNIYAAEALWEAKISPTVLACRVSLARCKRLVTSVRLVLERAPAARYYERDGRSLTGDTALSGMSDAAWRVYGREGEPCVRCKTPIKRIVQGGRSTFYCPHCQRG
ncbi:MAG: bifunctional DNA-formamidopyrimidine glycosylase/DNA-(apurinic or apyrimidinic site) lyase [Gemmatimonadaceae bacterium]